MQNKDKFIKFLSGRHLVPEHRVKFYGIWVTRFVAFRGDEAAAVGGHELSNSGDTLLNSSFFSGPDLSSPRVRLFRSIVVVAILSSMSGGGYGAPDLCAYCFTALVILYRHFVLNLNKVMV